MLRVALGLFRGRKLTQLRHNRRCLHTFVTVWSKGQRIDSARGWFVKHTFGRLRYGAVLFHSQGILRFVHCSLVRRKFLLSLANVAPIGCQR